jgi:DNA-binding transcriptional ArsR family regulator
MKTKREAGEMRSFKIAALLLLTCLLTFSIITSVDAQEEPPDTDSDGMPDDYEDNYGFNSTDPSDGEEDPDSDGLNNTEEYEIGTEPDDPDTDSDGMPDGWEYENDLYPTNFSAENDEDRDGFTDLWEYEKGTNPNDEYEPDDDAPGAPGETKEDEGSTAAGFFLCGPLFIIAAFIIVIVLIVGIYSKIKRDRLLDHETRQRIFDFIKENPGTYYSQIRKDLDLAHGVVTHHLNMMETQELVFSKQDRQFRRFYVDGLYKDAPMVTGVQKKVLDEIRRYPGSAQKQISEHLDLYPMLVSYHVGQLEDLNLVEKKKEGRRNLLYARTKSKEEKIIDEVLSRGPFEGPAAEMGIAEN